MADSKLADLTTATSLGGDEYVYVVDDPAGTPVDRKATVATVLGSGAKLLSAKNSDGTEYLSVPGVVVTATFAVAMVADVVKYGAFVCDTPVTIDEAFLEVTVAGAAGKVIRIAIYNADADWQPGTLVRDCGTVAADSTGVKSITGLAQVLPPGRYLSRVHSDGTPTIRCSTGSVRGGPIGRTLGAATYLLRLEKNLAYATAESPGTKWDTIVTSGTGAGSHAVVFRVEA